MLADNLSETRACLLEALGDKREKYFTYMKLWFRMKISKESFDTSARSMLDSSNVHLHNEFLLAILTKCQLFSNVGAANSDSYRNNDDQKTEFDFTTQSSGPSALSTTPDKKKAKHKKKTKVSRNPEDGTFEPVCLQDIAPTPNLREPQVISDAHSGYHSRTLTLLEIGHLKGRLLLAAWDHGLTSVGDSVSLLIQEASKQCLKNVIEAVVSQRRAYKIRDKRFLHSFGISPPNPWFRNAASLSDWTSESLGHTLGDGNDLSERPIWPSIDVAEQNAAHLASCTPNVPVPLPPINCTDLFLALKKKRVLPCHTVNSLCMERLSSHLWHPSWIDLEQEEIASQELALQDATR